MYETKTVLAELRAQIEANRKTLEEQERALVVLEKMMAQSGSTALPVSTQLAKDSSVINVEQLMVSGDIKRSKLQDEVADVAKRLGDQEFTVAHIYAAMVQMGKPPKGKSPKARIALIAGKLVESGLLALSFKGGGNVPNRYMLKEVYDKAIHGNASQART